MYCLQILAFSIPYRTQVFSQIFQFEIVDGERWVHWNLKIGRGDGIPNAIPLMILMDFFGRGSMDKCRMIFFRMI